MANEVSLRRAYAEICHGFSVGTHEGKPLYVKHLTVFDQTDVDVVREAAFDEAVVRGVKTEEAKLKWLAGMGLWAKKDETDLSMQRDYVEALYKTRSKMPLKVQVDQANKQIEEGENKLWELSNRRARMIGLTAEQVADQKVQYEYMRLSFFRDTHLKEPLFTPKSIGKLDHDEADNFLMSYVNIVGRFVPDTLRRIAVAPFFTNSFYLCGDKIDIFFGKSIVGLSLYQTNLLSYGQYFKSLMTQNDVPKEYLDNPDKIEECIMRSRNLKSAADKVAAGAENVALFGATSEDFKALGVKDSTDKVREDITKNVESGLHDQKSRQFGPKRA